MNNRFISNWQRQAEKKAQSNSNMTPKQKERYINKYVEYKENEFNEASKEIQNILAQNQVVRKNSL